MSSNSTNKIYVVTDIDCGSTLPSYSVSVQDDLVALTNVTDGGVAVFLPDNPSAGDMYTVSDADGTCGAESPILIQATNDIQESSDPYEVNLPFASVTFVFDEGTHGWMVTAQTSLAITSYVQEFLPAATQGPGASESTGNAAITVLTGTLRVTAQMSVQSSAAGLGITFQLLRGATPIGKPVVVGTGADTEHVASATLVVVDTGLELDATPNYSCTATASAGTVTLPAASCEVLLENIQGTTI